MAILIMMKARARPPTAAPTMTAVWLLGLPVGLEVESEAEVLEEEAEVAVDDADDDVVEFATV